MIVEMRCCWEKELVESVPKVRWRRKRSGISFSKWVKSTPEGMLQVVTWEVTIPLESGLDEGEKRQRKEKGSGSIMAMP